MSMPGQEPTTGNTDRHVTRPVARILRELSLNLKPDPMPLKTEDVPVIMHEGSRAQHENDTIYDQLTTICKMPQSLSVIGILVILCVVLLIAIIIFGVILIFRKQRSNTTCTLSHFNKVNDDRCHSDMVSQV